MLVLTRKKSEKILIGSQAEIEICVVEILGDKVRIGITAPKDVPVHRQEVYDAIQAGVPRSEGGDKQEANKEVIT